MKIGTKLCVHCGCIVAQLVGQKWLCAKCGVETTPEQEAEFERLAMLAQRRRPIDPSVN
jgi:ribosomal protein S27AE